MLETNRLGRGFSINVRNEFQILLSIPPTHHWPKKERLFANCTAGQENNLKTLSIRYFGRRLSTNNPCQVSRLRRFVTKQEMEGETCFILWYNEVLCATNRCDNITVLDTLPPSPKWSWLLLKFLHLPSGWEHWKNGAKNLFSDTSGAFFCLNLLPVSHPVPGTKPSPTNQLRLAGGMKSAGAVPSSSPGSAQPGLANPSLHVERGSRLFTEAELCTHSTWPFRTVTVETLPKFVLPRLWQAEPSFPCSYC